MTEAYFTPKFSGARFRDKTVPADVLPDIAALQELLSEMAKADYLKSHPERVRAPKNFDDRVQIHLAQIDEGSAKLVLVLFFATFMPEFGPSFHRAQAEVTSAIAAVTNGERPELEPRFLGYFDRVGKGLREGEALEFPKVDGSYVALNQSTRRALIEASEVEEFTERATLRGRIPMTDYRGEKFDVQLMDNSVVPCRVDPANYEQVEAAHSVYRTDPSAWLLLKGVVKKTRSGKLLSIESLGVVRAVDALDVAFRLKELRKLEDGWLDGTGQASPKRA